MFQINQTNILLVVFGDQMQLCCVGRPNVARVREVQEKIMMVVFRSDTEEMDGTATHLELMVYCNLAFPLSISTTSIPGSLVIRILSILAREKASLAGSLSLEQDTDGVNPKFPCSLPARCSFVKWNDSNRGSLLQKGGSCDKLTLN